VRSRFWIRLAWAAYVPLVLAALWEQSQLLVGLLGRPWANAIDYRLYRVAAQIGMEHGWSHIYDEALQRRAILAFWPRTAWPAWWHARQAFWTPMVSPPPAAWLAAPLNRLPLEVAGGLWLGLLGIGLVTTALLAAPPEPLARLRYVSMLLLTWTTVIALISGNLVVLIGLAIIVAWRLLEAGHDVAAGLVLAVAAVKPQVVFVIPLLLLVVGCWQAVVTWTAAFAIIFAASVLTLGQHGLAAYRQLLGLVGGFQGEQTLSLAGLPIPVALKALLWMLVMAACAAVVWRQRDRGPAVAISVGLLASLALSPYLNVEDFVLLVPVALILVRARRTLAEAALALALVLTATPASQGFAGPTYVAGAGILLMLVAA
jgi:hypothetical protein